jgi:hypothetical protein
MPKKEPLQGGEPIRGDPSIAQGGYSGKIPAAAFAALEWEVSGIMYGTATLTIHIRDGRLARFTTRRECSHMAEDPNE